jgi:hypothetical protein
LDRGPIGRQRDEVVANGGNLLDQSSPVASSQRSMVCGWSAMEPMVPDGSLAG